MDVRKLAAERLGQMELMCQAAKNLSKEIKRLERSGKDPALQKKLAGELRSAQLWVDVTRQAMQVLTPEEMLVAQRLFLLPAKGNVQRLCQELGVEQSSVYRRRDRVLQKVGMALFATMDN